MSLLHLFNFPKCKFAFGYLHSTKGKFGKQTQKATMSDEKIKLGLKNSASAVMRITVHYPCFLKLAIFK